MAGINTTTSRSTDRCRDELPPCPVCKGLECLCRPRFFPGQLLSDEDLNRLQNYVIGKNKLEASKPQLPQTQETLKEDVRWAKAQKN